MLDSVVVTGDQDTLLLDSAGRGVQGRVYVTDSLIQGNVDFIFGRATAVSTGSVIEVTTRPDGSSGGYVTAPSTAPACPASSSPTGHHRRRRGRHVLPRPAWYAGGDAFPPPADHRPRHRAERRHQGHPLDRHERIPLAGRPVRRVPQHRPRRGRGQRRGRPQLTDERPRRRKPATGAATGPPDRTAPGGGGTAPRRPSVRWRLVTQPHIRGHESG
ncbi:hypothetical protein [Streptomyces sp. 7-21]|uniref:hypothetical protein n=1 Tax=Streptomyces sp. 7-21 TaxID=2802283 RepID=UPI0027DD2A95|nr:hypothetical protein [Streptomyces sp. 7-21]